MAQPTLAEQAKVDRTISAAFAAARNAKADLSRTYFIKQSAVEYSLYGTPLTPEAKAFIAKWS